MIFPVGDTPNPRGFRPWVNYALIAVNVLVFLAITLPLSFQLPRAKDPALAAYTEFLRQAAPGVPMRALLEHITAYDLFVWKHGFQPGAPSIVDLFSSMFLHSGLLHLAGNMLFLWIYGDNVEHRIGRLPYLVAYLSTGVVSVLAFSAVAWPSLTPLIGASGAISGVLGMYFVLFPRNKVKTFVFLFPFVMRTILLPARWVLGVYLVIDNLLPFLLGSGGNVAHGAHIGGFLAGLAVGWVGEQAGWRPPWADQRVLGGHEDDMGEALRVCVARGDRDASLALLGRGGREALGALDVSETIRLAGWLIDEGHSGAAHAVLIRASHRAATKPEQARLRLALALLLLRQGQPASAWSHLHRALELDPDPETEAMAREALHRLGG